MSTRSAACKPSFEDAYERYWVTLVRLALLLTGRRELAEDVVQGVFASTYPRWGDIGEPLPYLRRAVANASADVHRRSARERLLRPDPEPVTGIPEVDETWASLRRLPTRQRTVVVLHFYEDLPLVDIARVLDRPATTIRSDLRRALERLRKDLS